jgi:hypothetical protein
MNMFQAGLLSVIFFVIKTPNVGIVISQSVGNKLKIIKAT